MGGLIETDKMLLHRETCLVCQAADGDIEKYCDPWGEMYENFIDWQSGEGPGTHAAYDQDQENADRG